jgi:ABC-type branched-subunit amino acid transport system substrate-binding protein
MKMADTSRNVPRRGASRWAAVVLVVGALVVAACGSSSSSSKPAATTVAAGGSATTKAATGAATTAAAGGAAAAKGDPIKVMTEAPIDTNSTPYPNIREAAKVYAQYINDKGGIKGRPLEVVFCDDKNDPNEAGNCARKAVEQKLVANVGSFTIDVSRGIPIYEENKIAWFGACCPIVAQENTSKISFPMGFVGGFTTAAALKMIDDGCKSIVDVYGDLPVADVFHTGFVNGFKSRGLDPAKAGKMVKIPVAVGDYSSQAAQMNSPVIDCLFGNIGESNWPPLINALDSVGAHPRLYGPQGNLDSKVAGQFPKQTNGGFVMNVYPNLAADVWKDYRDSLVKYKAPDLDWNSLAGLGTWTAFTAFTKIVEGMSGEITGATFLDAASKTSKVDTGGMVGILDFTKEWAGGGGAFPRIFNRNIFVDAIKDGKLTPVGDKPIDVSNSFDGKPA